MAVDFDAVWTGSTSTLWELAANWSPPNIPTAAEDIFIPAGKPSIDATGMVDTQFGVMHIARGYTGTIGATGTPLNGGFTDIRHNGSGKLWYTDAAQTTNRIIIDAPGNADAATIDGTITTVVVVLRGTVTLAGSAGVLPRLEIGYRSSRATDATVVLVGGANAVTLIEQWGGNLISTRTITKLNQYGGEAVQNVGYAMTEANIAAKLDYRSNTTLGTLRLYGGSTGDFTQGRTNDLTVTNSYFYPDSNPIFDKNLVDFTAATNYDWRT